MKKFTAAVLLTGSTVLMGMHGAALAQSTGGPAAETDFSYPSDRTPQYIVTFHGTQSFGQELAALRSSLAAQAANPAELDELVAANRATLERDIRHAARARVADLRASAGFNVKWQRALATGADVVRFDPSEIGMSHQEFMLELEADPAVASVEFDALLKPMFTPNDQFYSAQWHYYEATAGLNLESAWDTATGAGVTVAVLDTGHRPHVDLIGNIIGGYDFISDSSSARDGNGRDSNAEDEGDWTTGECGPASNSSWHGTHVSGTIAAVTNNGTGVAGVAYNADILSVRVLGRCGGSLSDIADAVIWSSGGSVAGVPNNSNPAEVINMSLGGSGSCGSTYQNAINTAVGNGTVVVVAAGNSNTNASGARPANCANVVTVAALDRQGNRASYSNYGSVIDVAAPGGETSPTSSNGVASTLNAGTTTPGGDNYVYYQGTSMATPHVAGVAALMIDENPSLTPAEIESILASTSRSIPGSCSGGCGAGLVDATAAVAGSTGGGGGG
ncbi:MAG: S8 family peptidase, partial [Pseudomonadota bacterium]